MQETLKLLEELKLRGFSSALEEKIDKHPKQREEILEVLKSLSKTEIAQRKEKSVAYRVCQAHFGEIKTIDTFDFNFSPSTIKAKNRYLKLLEADIVSQKLSVLFVGTSGAGKTHLAKSLGYRLCQKNTRVRFTTFSALGIDLSAADSAGILKRVLLQYTQPELLILDEIGYVSRLRELESNLVFQIISQRYESGRSSVITTNKPFGEWNQIFHNDAMAHAIIDRLAERSEVFHLEGPSYREAHRKRLAD